MARFNMDMKIQTFFSQVQEIWARLMGETRNSDTAVITNIPSFNFGVSTILAPANPLRRGIRIFNNSSNSIYLCAAPLANSGTAVFAIVPTFQAFEFNMINYRGVISGIRNAGLGNVIVTEFI